MKYEKHSVKWTAYTRDATFWKAARRIFERGSRKVPIAGGGKFVSFFPLRCNKKIHQFQQSRKIKLTRIYNSRETHCKSLDDAK